MKREEAIKIYTNLLIGEGLVKHFTKFLICGSIRRKKPLVNDIDIVAMVRPRSSYSFGEVDLGTHIKQLDPQGAKSRRLNRFANGDKIKRFIFQGAKIELYLANEETYETLVLIRTGSKYHNIRLTTQAQNRGLKLFANGTGLCEVDREGNPTKIIENTEKGIINNLLGFYVEPERRD